MEEWGGRQDKRDACVLFFFYSLVCSPYSRSLQTRHPTFVQRHPPPPPLSSPEGSSRNRKKKNLYHTCPPPPKCLFIKKPLPSLCALACPPVDELPHLPMCCTCGGFPLIWHNGSGPSPECGQVSALNRRWPALEGCLMLWVVPQPTSLPSSESLHNQRFYSIFLFFFFYFPIAHTHTVSVAPESSLHQRG